MQHLSFTNYIPVSLIKRKTQYGMRKRPRWIKVKSFLFLLLIPGTCHEQSSKAEPDTALVHKLINRAEALPTADSDSTLALLNEGIRLSKQIAYPVGQVRALEALGDWHVSQGAFAAAIKEYRHALTVQESLGRQQKMGHTWIKMANAAKANKDYEKAKAYFEEGYAAFESVNDKVGMAKTRTEQGVILYLEGDYEGATVAQDESMSLSVMAGDGKGECLALRRKGVIFTTLRKMPAAKNHFIKAIKIARQANYREEWSAGTSSLGHILIKEGNYREAQRYLDESLGISDGDSTLAVSYAAALLSKGDIFRLQGRYDQAFQVYSLAKAKMEELGYDFALPHINFQIGQIHLYLGEDDTAMNYFKTSLQIAKANKETQTQSEALYYMGLAKEKQNDWVTALQYFEESLALSKEAQFKEQIVRVQNQIGQFYKREGLFEKSFEYYEQSLEVLEHHANLTDIVSTYNLLGELYVEIGNFDEAFHYHNLAEDLLDESVNIDLKSSTLSYRGDTHSAQGNLTQAEEAYVECLQLLEQIGKISIVPQVSNRLGKFYLDQKRHEEALPLLEKSLEISQQIKDKLQEAEANLLISRLYLQFEDFQRALDHALEANTFELLSYQFRSAKQLADIYSYSNNYKAAYTQLLRFNSLSDSLSQQKSARILERELAELEAIRNLEITRKEKQLQLYFIWALLAVGIAALLGAYAFYTNSKKNKQLANKELAFRRMRDNLFANISHDFRTPLTVLKSSLDEMRKGTLMGSYISHAQMLYRNTDNLTRLTNQMLDLARMSEGRMKLKPVATDLNHTVRMTLLPLSSLAQAKNISFQFTMPVKHATFLFDPNAVQKVVQNLVYNAVKFTPEGGQLDVILTIGSTHWTVKVADTGIGIAPDHLPYIFDRYYRSSFNKSETGGLGLSLAKQLVELGGGSIEVQSELGKGTVFSVHWPNGIDNFPTDQYQTFISETIGMHEKDETADTLPPKASFSTERLITQVDSTAPQLLIAEDDPDLNMLLYQQLSEEYRIIRTFNGKEAMQLLKEEAPDLILTDIMMPEMDGIQFVEQVMADRDCSHVPIIVLSALEQDVEDMKLWREGIVDFVNKPYNIDILRYRIANQLRIRREFRERLSKEGWNASSLANAPLTSVDKAFLEELKQCFEEHLDEIELDIDHLTRILGLSRTSLYNKVKSLTGHSPSIFLRKYRMNRAKELLSLQVGNVTEVAFQVGYSNLSQFSRVFKEEFGISPSTFRKES